MEPKPLNGGICDCGHLPTLKPASAITVGYGIDSATGETACYACCAEKERAAMIATGRATLYLVESDGSKVEPFTARDRMRVTDWPGLLVFPVSEFRRSARGGGFGSQRTDAWFNGPDGYVWHAINRGDSQIARCRRTRVKVRA